MTLDPEQLRIAMRAWATGVTVVTAAHGGQQHGMTVSSFTSISLDPPLVAVSLAHSSRTHELVQKSGELSITILAADQGDLSDRFAGRYPEIVDRLEGIDIEKLLIDAPLLKGGVAYFNCRVTDSMTLGGNTLFIGEVIAARGNGEGEPLLYHNRAYRKLAK